MASSDPGSTTAPGTGAALLPTAPGGGPRRPGERNAQRRSPRFFGIHAEPGRTLGIALALLPFIALVIAYVVGSAARRAENPSDKLLPSLSRMAESVNELAFVEDSRAGGYLLVDDTLASLKRIGMGIGLAAFCGLFLGLNLGAFPGFSALLLPFITFVSIIPPLSLLPILFITFGVDELAKVMLIFIGTFPMIARDIHAGVRRLPAEQRTKALTLGARDLALVYRITLPQVLPRLLETVRLSLGSGWLFLIAAEAIAAENGLGYRIFLVRRYLAMDVIIPYALWITFIGYAVDQLLRWFVAWAFPWYKHAS